MIGDIRTHLARWRNYRAIASELNGYSDRELADIGLSRLSISEFAWKAAA